MTTSIEALEFSKVLLDLIREAGQIALNLIDHSCSELKADTSVITDADRSISALAHLRLARYLDSGQHVLIDEEDPRRAEYLDSKRLQAASFLWAIDPIDATRAYANRMPHYGISIGLMKSLRPWMGAVFFPSLGELFFCDGEKAVFVRQAFSDREERVDIVAIDEEISSRSVFICTDELLGKFAWKSSDCRVMIFSAAVCEFCWPAIGRGCGSLSRVFLWDMAGSWPIFEKAGLKMFSVRTGRPLDHISTDLFHQSGEPWRFKDYFILSSPRNFKSLRSKLIDIAPL